MICNRCNHEIPDGSATCPYCGNSIGVGGGLKIAGNLQGAAGTNSAPAAPQAPVYGGQPPVSPNPSYGTPSPAPASGGEVSCPKCGNKLPAGAKFCASCGSPVSAGAPAYAASPTPPAPPAPPAPGYGTGYSAPAPAPAPGYGTGYPAPAPVGVDGMQSNFSLVKFFFLSLITFGIYGVYTVAKMGEYLNTIAGRNDGKRTMSFWLIWFLLGPITCGIMSLVWYHQFSERIGQELVRRRIPMDFGAGTFWIYNILLSIVIVGPFIYIHKLCNAMNALVDSYHNTGY